MFISDQPINGGAESDELGLPSSYRVVKIPNSYDLMSQIMYTRGDEHFNNISPAVAPNSHIGSFDATEYAENLVHRDISVKSVIPGGPVIAVAISAGVVLVVAAAAMVYTRSKRRAENSLVEIKKVQVTKILENKEKRHSMPKEIIINGAPASINVGSKEFQPKLDIVSKVINGEESSKKSKRISYFSQTMVKARKSSISTA